jgi:3-methyladenine DNA glycosylase AlkD
MTSRRSDDTPRAASLASLRRGMRAAADPAKAKILAGFFKTGAGQYGEGDVFLGLTVPVSRALAARHASLGLRDVEHLLHSKIHEERLVGLLLLVRRFSRGGEPEKKAAFDFYVRHADRANNWDLVDLSADKIVGAWLLDRPKALLASLARSTSLWRRRIAIVATFAFIRAGRFADTFRVADLLRADGHDLIHKAVGWMLREVGKRDKAALVAYLKPRYKTMPRTMLRYAIERFPEAERKRYLAGKV